MKLKKQKIQLLENNLKYNTNKRLFNFQKFKTMRSFGEDILRSGNTISEVNEKQGNFLNGTSEFNDNDNDLTKGRSR